jgi:outer membrane biosynthesis protein TonB
MAPVETAAKPADKPTAKPSAQSQAKPASKPAAKTSAGSKPKPRPKTPARSTAKPAAKTAAKTPAERSVSAAQHAEHQPAFGGREWAGELLDMQEQTVRFVADYQRRAGESARLPWVATIARGQADVLVSVTDAYVSAARRLLVN